MNNVNTGYYSFAAGYNSIASGTNSTALGGNTTASNTYAVAWVIKPLLPAIIPSHLVLIPWLPGHIPLFWVIALRHREIIQLPRDNIR